MEKLQFKDIFLGKIDAYNEYIEYGETVFKDLFFSYPSLNIDKILNGSIYYIYGDKGTGKTMLLKYIQTVIEEQPELNFSKFIRFRRDIDDEQRDQFKRAATPSQLQTEEVIDNGTLLDPALNCVLVWQVYLIKTIINKLNVLEGGVFKRTTKEWTQLVTLLEAVYDEDSKKGKFSKLLPKIKRGKLVINLSKYGKIDLDLEWDSQEENVVKFSTVAKKIVDLYQHLEPDDDAKIYILIDELELSLNKNKQFMRDITLIRDLIFAVQYLSEINKLNNFKVFIVTALRTEVLRSAISKGSELNKPVQDFGMKIEWHQKGGDIKKHPLIQMLEQRFKYSEKGKNLNNNIWEIYFPEKIHNRSTLNYILDQTWFRPRDIIRLFSIIQSTHGDKSFADQAIFDSIRQQYASESWSEFEEMLTATYSDTETVGIRHALTAIKAPFTTATFRERIDGNAETFAEVEELIKNKRNPARILRDLYDLGIIGNDGKFVRFSFRGEMDIDPMGKFIFHYPLKRFFKT